MESFQSTLEQVVLAQSPELYIYAQKLHKGMIEDIEEVYVEIHRESVLFPIAPERYKFKETKSYATVKVNVIKHDKLSNKVLLADGKWYGDYKHPTESNATESKWIKDLEPIQIPTEGKD